MYCNVILKKHFVHYFQYLDTSLLIILLFGIFFDRLLYTINIVVKYLLLKSDSKNSEKITTAIISYFIVCYAQKLKTHQFSNTTTVKCGNDRCYLIKL